jgi:sugar lactone lactonase YvrE
MTRQPTVVLDKLSFLESPRFRDGRLWLSDFYTHRVLSCLPDGSDLREEATVPAQPSGLGWLPDGRLLIVSMRDQRVLRREPDGTLVTHADLGALARGVCNDMVVDAAGHAYVGCFGFDLMNGAPVETAPLLRVDPDGGASVVAEDLYFPNGAVVIGDHLVVAESIGNRISAFDIASNGSLGPRRDWARFGDVPDSTDPGEALGAAAVAPDGICADAEGAVWAADDGHTLFLCTAPGFAEHERRDTRDAVLLAVRVDVPAA